MESSELAALFAGGESDRVERVESPKNKDKIGAALCAFANDLPGHGAPGVLFVGQKDDGGCAGLSVDDGLLRELGGYASDGQIMPPPVLSVSKQVFDGCQICAVVVRPADNPPVRYKGVCWVRVGPRQKRATPAEEAILAEKRQAGEVAFIDQSFQPPIEMDELNQAAFSIGYLPRAVSAETLEENNRSAYHQMLSLGFIAPNGHPSRAAALCFHPRPQRHVGGAIVIFARWRGTEIHETDKLMRHLEIGGSIFDQISRLDDLIFTNVNQKPVFTDDGLRNDYLDYPYVALRELLRNAIIHRTYEGTNAPIRFFWYSNRIEIDSPGGPYGRRTVENFADANAPADYRNLTLAQACKTMDFAERFGSGIPRARAAMKENGNPDIEFDVSQHSVRAILRPAYTIEGF